MDMSAIWLSVAACLILECTGQEATPKTMECTEGTATRTFANLTEYQGTKSSFDPKNPTYQGNMVEFSFERLDRLQKNTFIAFGSNSIYKIDLSRKMLSRIDEGAFLELFCLHELDLSYNNLSHLPEGAFQGLENLRKLSLNHNGLKYVPDLNTLHRINHLDLSVNAITAIKKLPLLSELSVLDLSYNYIKEIKKDAFRNLPALKQLLLNNDLLTEIEPDQWEGLRNLSTLDLAGNRLKSFDTSNVLPFAQLTTLNLSTNSLTSINTFYLKRHLPRLTYLDIRQNFWSCIEMEKLQRDLLDTKIALASPMNCSQAPVLPIYTTSAEVTTSKMSTTTRTPEYLRDIKSQNREILENNAVMRETLLDVYYILVFLSVMLVGFVTVSVLSRYGICRRIDRIRRGECDESERVLLRG